MVTTKPKTWTVTAKAEEYYYYEVDAETYEEAEEIAKEQFINETPQDWDVTFDIEKEVAHE